MSVGALGRNFEARVRLAGTYDEKWLENTFPFLPSDFDFRYFQSAPPDQQIPYPRGGERVQLQNLTPEPLPAFRLPRIEVPVEATDVHIKRTEQQAVLDTIVLEPDRGRMQLVWRTSFPLRRNIHEMRQVVVGRMSKGWYRARALGKTHHRSLRHLAGESRR
jgi:hypothetical protein